jgi:hypothetical protein
VYLILAVAFFFLPENGSHAAGEAVSMLVR